MDLSRVASYGRMAEHCADSPSCELHACRTEAGDGTWVPRLVLIAARDIEPGQLVTLDYSKHSITGCESHAHADWILQLFAAPLSVPHTARPADASISTLIATHFALSSALSKRASQNSDDNFTPETGGRTSGASAKGTCVCIHTMSSNDRNEKLASILKRLRKEPVDLLHQKFQRNEQHAPEKRRTKDGACTLSGC